MLRESWRNRVGFALAAMGSAVGLASIVRFPYLVADHGGAAFIFIYLMSLFLLAIPILIAEIHLGQVTQKNCYEAFVQKGKTSFWRKSGFWILSTALIVSAFYSALSGWIIGYFIEALSNQLAVLKTPPLASFHFHQLLLSPYWALFYHFAFISLSTAFVYTGLRDGIERGCKVLMPVLFFTLIVLVIKGLTLPSSSQALEYLFKPNWELITPNVVLMALGQAFFTLSLGQGTMITYGSYLPQKVPFIGSCVSIACAVVIVSILSAIAVFTIIFSANITPEGGLGLMFQTLPVVFSQMSGGYFLSVSFFLLVGLAALTSEISVLEPTIAYLVDRYHWSRKKAAIITGSIAFLIGIPCALSTNVLKSWVISGKNILEIFDIVATTFLVPVGGLLGVLLVAWRWGFSRAFKDPMDEKSGKARLGFIYLKLSLKYLCPVLIIFIFLAHLKQFWN